MRDKLQKVPTWVGLLGALLFAVLVTVAVVELYQRGILPLAGPLVAAAWAPLLVWLRITGIRVRTLRRRRILTERLGNLSRLVAAERHLPFSSRGSAATDRSLAEAGSLVATAADLLAANRADAVTVVGQLGRVSERWRSDAPLTRTVGTTVAAAQKLTLAWGEVNDARARA